MSAKAVIARIPTKKANHPAMCYLEADEVEAILRQPDQSRSEGQRDCALLAFLYNTGARIQEALDVTPGAKALEQASASARPGKPPRWKRDPELLSWLDSM
jgi:site-specific recombinase XerD